MQTVAEKKAWELSKQLGFDLVTIMPSLVLGPVTGQRNDGTSLNVMKVTLQPHPAVESQLCTCVVSCSSQPSSVSMLMLTMCRSV